MLQDKTLFKSPCLAFKIATEAEKLSTGIGNFFEREITKHTGGRFCHVAGWINGSITEAFCHESVEPSGTHRTTYDLTQPEWELVQLPQVDKSLLNGWSIGDCGRHYGAITIGGIALGSGWISSIDSTDRICSEDMFYMCRDIILIYFPNSIQPGLVVPDSPHADKIGLYELVTSYIAKNQFFKGI